MLSEGSFTRLPSTLREYEIYLAALSAGTDGGGGLTDAQLRAAPVPTASGASELHIGEVGGRSTVPTASLTRPADTTAYASGDLVADSTTAGSVTPLTWTVARVASGSGMIRRCRLRKSGTAVANAQFRVHLFRVSPTVTNGDNGAWLANQVANYMGALDVSVDRAFSDGSSGSGQPITGSEINFALASGQSVFGLIEARAAYTPTASEVFTIELEVIQN